MKTIFTLMALLVAFQDPCSACGQGILGLTAPRPGDIPVAPGKGLVDRHDPGSLWYYYASRAKVGGYIINPSGRYSVSRVTLLYLSPPAPAASQPAVTVPPVEQNHAIDHQAERVPPPHRAEAEAPSPYPTPLAKGGRGGRGEDRVRGEPEALAPGAPASVFRPIRPEDRARAAMPAVPEPARPELPGPLPLWPEPPPLPGPPAAAAEPKTAGAQHLLLGTAAFQTRQYSRAERHFRGATEALPEDPTAPFLLAQAQLALGKYAEAVAVIHAGLRLRPDWPSVDFRPRALYGTHPDDFSADLQRLMEALANYPEDSVLAFLCAYELWFDNRKDEARMIFQRAKAFAPDPRFIERFLQT